VLNLYGGSLIKALLSIYPHMEPVEEITQVVKKVGENVLQKTVKKLFGVFGCEVICNARKIADMKQQSKWKTYYELDVWIPSLNIGFEYQVKHTRHR
jgi:hypothetical protein